MKKYLNIEFNLTDCKYKFIDEDNVKSVKIDAFDTIEIEKIKDEKIYLAVNRQIKFTPLANAYVDVTFNVLIEAEEKVKKETLIEDIKKEIPLLGIVYSSVSLIISELTKECKYGTIVTPPMYDGKKVQIK